MDYLYNIRGWMTRINDPKNLNGKLFGYEIKYNTVEGLETPNLDYTGLQVKPKYNGNIAEVDWRTGTTSGDNLRRYGYVYDSLNRLSAGFYQKDSNPSAKEYFEKMDYDLNGNITNLKRSAQSKQGAAAFNIDDLVYAYANNNQSNRLTSVTDSSTDYRGYPDVSGIAIPYDVNGNMTSQKDKGILQIDYNFLNLPNYMKFDDTYIVRNAFGGINETRNITTKYIFRADGTKVSKLYTYGIARNRSEAYKITEYLDGFQYESNAASTLVDRILRFVPTSEGYYNFENNKYIYNYTDHLGNVRLSYFNNGSSVEVLEENNYYPFGMKHEGYNVSAGNSSYQYKYNGKELQTESGMYDYGARFYMPDVGRWGVVDPLAEKMRRYSPYNYAFNNPMRFTDPDGRKPEDIIIVGSNVKFSEAKKILMQTSAGRELWNKYSKSKTTDIYISFGSISNKEKAAGRTANGIEKTTAVKNSKITIDPKSAIPEFKPFDGIDISKSKGKNVALVLLNTNPDTGYFSSNEKAEKYHSERSGGENKNSYDNAEVIYHEIKAHVDLAGSKDQHEAYGLTTAGIMRDDVVPRKGSPAETMKKQLSAVYENNNKEKNEEIAN